MQGAVDEWLARALAGNRNLDVPELTVIWRARALAEKKDLHMPELTAIPHASKADTDHGGSFLRAAVKQLDRERLMESSLMDC